MPTPLTSTELGYGQAGADSAAYREILAKRLAAADARERVGLNVNGNIMTNRALRPITAESDALQARIDARNRSGVVMGPASDLPAPAARAGGLATGASGGAYAKLLTPRKVMPTVDSTAATAAEPAASETPWWARSAFADNPAFDKFVKAGGIANAGAVAREGTPLLRLNRKTYVPQSVNYNQSSDL